MNGILVFAFQKFIELTTRGFEMNKFINSVKKFVVSEDGPTAVEYAVMLALIIVVCLAAITTIGSAANAQFTAVGSYLQ